MSIAHGRTFPSEHAFLKLREPDVMAPDEPDPPEEKTIEWLQARLLHIKMYFL